MTGEICMVLLRISLVPTECSRDRTVSKSGRALGCSRRTVRWMHEGSGAGGSHGEVGEGVAQFPGVDVGDVGGF